MKFTDKSDYSVIEKYNILCKIVISYLHCYTIS
jgi:hypothetical protein